MIFIVARSLQTVGSSDSIVCLIFERIEVAPPVEQRRASVLIAACTDSLDRAAAN